jgi:hypothetical protein
VKNSNFNGDERELPLANGWHLAKYTSTCGALILLPSSSIMVTLPSRGWGSVHAICKAR